MIQLGATSTLIFTSLVTVFPSPLLATCGNQEPRGDADRFRFEDPLSPDFDDESDFDFSFFETNILDGKITLDPSNDSCVRNTCDVDSGFYFLDFPITVTFSFEDDSEEELETVTETRDFTCQQALGDIRQEAKDAIVSTFDLNNFPEGDDVQCCDNNRFTLFQTVGPVDVVLDEEIEVEVSVNILNVLGETNAQRFADLCEELWFCSQYIRYDDNLQCEEQGGSRCPSFIDRTLCFDTIYDTRGRCGRRHEVRERFVIESCWGLSQNEDFGAGAEDGERIFDPIPTNDDGIEDRSIILTNLEDNVEGLCSSATERSRKRLFDPSPTCLSLLQCYKENLPSDLDDDSRADAEQALDESAFEICSDVLDEVLLEQVRGCEEGGTTQIREEYDFKRICPAYLTEFFTSFPPDYPDNDLDNPEYRSYILNNVNAAFNTRTDASQYGILKITRHALAAAVIAAELLIDALPDDLLYFWKALPYARLAPPLRAVEASIDRFDFHDGNVDGAEIEAIYENSRQLLDGEAAVYEAVRCRPVSELKWGHGCDSVDNDCDRSVDECDEDEIDPIIDTRNVHAQCAEQWFQSVDEARDCIDFAAIATDDCDPNVNIETTFKEGTCNSATFTIDALTARCGQTSSVDVVAKVDSIAPELTCSVGGSTDTILQATGQTLMTDVDFVYTLNPTAGDCIDESTYITIKVFANEIEDLRNQAMAALFQKGDSDGKVGLYVGAGLCEQSSNGQCVQDPALEEARLYTIEVVAVDQAGNVGSCQSRVLILPTRLFGQTDFSIADESTQRFLLTEYSHSIN